MLPGFVLTKNNSIICESLEDFPDIEYLKICFFWKISELEETEFLLLEYENTSIVLGTYRIISIYRLTVCLN